MVVASDNDTNVDLDPDSRTVIIKDATSEIDADGDTDKDAVATDADVDFTTDSCAKFITDDDICVDIGSVSTSGTATDAAGDTDTDADCDTTDGRVGDTAKEDTVDVSDTVNDVLSDNVADRVCGIDADKDNGVDIAGDDDWEAINRTGGVTDIDCDTEMVAGFSWDTVGASGTNTVRQSLIVMPVGSKTRMAEALMRVTLQRRVSVTLVLMITSILI